MNSSLIENQSTVFMRGSDPISRSSEGVAPVPYFHHHKAEERPGSGNSLFNTINTPDT